VQFAHKLDTPATLGCEVAAFEPRNSSLLMRAECREKQKTFTLSLGLLRDIDPEGASWTTLSVGASSEATAVAVARED
jgi:hypothetical protein